MPGFSRHKSDQHLGQLPLEWPANLSPEKSLPEIPECSPPKQIPPSVAPPVSPAPRTIQKSLCEVVEKYLRDKAVPYISVDEAKKALFAGAKLRSFHFVVYRPTGTNWLLWAAQIRKESRQDLIEWKKIFGDGFVAVVAKQMKDATLKFRTLAGEAVELK